MRERRHWTRDSLISAATRRQWLQSIGVVASALPVFGIEPIFSQSRLDHLRIRSGNLSTSLRFYHDLFGGEILDGTRNGYSRPISSPDEIVLLKFTPGYPYLIFAPASNENPRGLDHLCMSSPGFSYTTVKAKIESLGIPPQHQPNPGNALYVRDEDAVLLEIFEAGSWSALQEHNPEAQLAPNFRHPKPAFEAIAIPQITVRTWNLERAADFYTNLFGTATQRQASNQRRTFRIGETTLELLSIAAPPRAAAGFGYMTIAVKNFSSSSATGILTERGINSDHRGEHDARYLSDPDGVELRLTGA